MKLEVFCLITLLVSQLVCPCWAGESSAKAARYNGPLDSTRSSEDTSQHSSDSPISQRLDTTTSAEKSRKRPASLPLSASSNRRGISRDMVSNTNLQFWAPNQPEAGPWRQIPVGVPLDFDVNYLHGSGAPSTSSHQREAESFRPWIPHSPIGSPSHLSAFPTATRPAKWWDRYRKMFYGPLPVVFRPRYQMSTIEHDFNPRQFEDYKRRVEALETVRQ